MKIGYIGLGALGSELARCFLARHELCVWDMNPAAAARLREDGARVMGSARELALQCEVVVLCLPRSSDVRQVIFGADGLVEGLSAGMLVIDQTSGAALETRAMARQLAEHGVDMMDAAVSAGPAFVAQGGAKLMASAPDAVFERALPLLREITQTIYRCGTAVGDGQAMKTVNNAMNGGCRLGTLEVVAMGRKAGLSLECMTDALNKGSGRSVTTERMLPAILQGKASTDFGLSLMLKDVNQAVQLGMQVGVPMPITSAVRTLLQIGVNTLGVQAQLEDMIGLIEKLAAATLRPVADSAPDVTLPAGTAPAPRRRVGYVGLGAMGGSLASRLVRLHTLHLYDARPERACPLVAAGAELASDLPALARACDIVMVCLPTSQDVREALFGPGGLAEGLTAGSVVVDQSGGDPRQSQQLATELSAIGVALVDAPVSGDPLTAAEGTIGILVGGHRDDCRRVQPLLASISPNQTYCGGHGTANMARLVNDSVSALCHLVTYECVAAGLKHGLNLHDMAQVLDLTSGWSAASRKLLPSLVAGRPSTNLPLHQLVKDLRIAAAISLEVDAAMSIADAARSVFEAAANQLGATAVIGDMARLYESMAAVDFRAP